MRALYLAVATVCLVAPLHAAVVDSSSAGFTVRHVITTHVPPDSVYRALIAVQRWWSPAHTWSGSASNLSLAAAAGGCFCERLAHGGSVLHMAVVYADPGHLLRMNGAIGPLQGYALAATMTWELEGNGGGTTLTLTYAVGGYVPSGITAFCGPVDGVLGEQVRRLQRLTDSGRPE